MFKNSCKSSPLPIIYEEESENEGYQRLIGGESFIPEIRRNYIQCVISLKEMERVNESEYGYSDRYERRLNFNQNRKSIMFTENHDIRHKEMTFTIEQSSRLAISLRQLRKSYERLKIDDKEIKHSQGHAPIKEIDIFEYPALQYLSTSAPKANIEIIFKNSGRAKRPNINMKFSGSYLKGNSSRNCIFRYKIKVFWLQFIPKNFDYTLEDNNFAFDLEFQGEQYRQSIDITSSKTQSILIQHILQTHLQNHPSITKKIIKSISLKQLKQTRILKNQYNDLIVYDLIDLEASVEIPKIFLKPHIQYSFKGILIKSTKGKPKKMVVGFKLTTQRVQLEWKSPLSVQAFDFYYDIDLKKQFPILHPKLLIGAIQLTNNSPRKYSFSQTRRQFEKHNGL